MSNISDARKFWNSEFEANSFRDWADDEIREHGDISFDDWADEEFNEVIHNGANPLTFVEWVNQENREAAHQAESFGAESKCACGCSIGKCGCDEGCKCGCNHKKGGAAWAQAESFESDVEEHSCSECGEEGSEGVCGCYLDNMHGIYMVSIRANNCPFCKTKGFELGTPCYSCGANFRKTKDSEGKMRWKEDTQTMLEMADYGAESFGADKGLGFIINPASIGKGLPTYWAFDVDNDQVNYQTCLTCTQPIDYEIDEDDEFSGVQCKSCESKYEYREYEV